MNKEPKWNIQHACVNHHEAVLEEYQKETNGFYFKGDFVKTAFVMDDDSVEHMWVKVTKVDRENQLISGLLWNIPISPSKEFVLKAKVTVMFSKVSSLIKADRSNLN